MRRYLIMILSITAIVTLCICTPSSAFMDDRLNQHGEEDLSLLTYKELVQLQADIAEAYKEYHVPTETQQKSVLKATQDAAKNYYDKNGMEISGWAWYDREYTYTRDWDFYTLNTHLDYKNKQRKSHQAKIYAEIYEENGKYAVAYLTADNIVILDVRSDYGGAKWLSQPKPKINSATNIDLSTYKPEELTALEKKAQEEIAKNHTASKNECSLVLNITKVGLEQYFLNMHYELKSYAWYESEYIYLKDWDYYWLETHVDYEPGPGKAGITEKMYSEICRVGEDYELVYLKLGKTVIRNRKEELVTTLVHGVPRYSWGMNADSHNNIMVPSENDADFQQSETHPVQGSALFIGDLTGFTDEQLTDAAEAIREEQQMRVKTHRAPDYEETAMNVGKHQNMKAEKSDLPESDPASDLKTTVDKSIATVEDGTVGTAAEESTAKNDGYLKNSKGSVLFSAVTSNLHITNLYEKGNKDWYKHSADIGGIYFEVISQGADGEVISLKVLDDLDTGSKDIFFRVVKQLFTAEDLNTATDWLKQNIGKEAQIQIGDAYIFLRLTEKKAPVMHILDEYHKDRV